MRLFALCLFLFLSTWSYAQTTLTGSISHNGINRDYRLYVPSGYSMSDTSLALVFNMHGFTSDAAQQEQSSQMNIIAENENFLVCYPNGINRSWNVGWTFGSNADDVGFISSLIDSLTDSYRIDQNRVYACGMSNGGFMAFRLACELQNKIAAVASVTGSMVPQALTSCQPDNPIPVLQIHGTQDFIVSYNGSAIASPVMDVVQFWATHNGCDKEPSITQVPDIQVNDNTTTEILTFAPCLRNSEVAHYRVQNGGHTWPRLNASIPGTSRDFEASQVIWDFFKRFKLEVPSSAFLSGNMHVQIYPNPFSENIQLTTDSYGKINIYNSCGTIIFSSEINPGTYNIDTHSWTCGWYLVHIIDSHHQKIIKLIKTH